MRLANKVAIITGVASGMGRACANIFTKEGAKVVGADIDDAAGKETIAHIQSKGGDAVFVSTDVSRESDTENLIKTAVEKYGRIDILLNVAGIPQKLIPIENITDDYWDKIYAVNVKGIFHTIKYAVPYMKKARSGTIINIASIGGILPRPDGCAYTSSKAAVIMLTKAASLELSPFNVRVNCINPGGTDTPFNMQLMPDGMDVEKYMQESISQFPLGRFIQPEEVAYAAVYLASDEAAMLSGTSITINQGLLV
jgi:3-oxoacyl-[acyl-carrier protein] reductase